MNARFTNSLILLVFLAVGTVWGKSPFEVSAVPGRTPDGRPAVEITLDVPAGHFLYEDTISARADVGLTPVRIPEPVVKHDSFSGEDRRLFTNRVTYVYAVEGAPPALALTIRYQGCDQTVCFFPQKVVTNIVFGAAASVVDATAPVIVEAAAPAVADWSTLIESFEVAGTAAGYLAAKDFLAFLDESSGGAKADATAGTDRAMWLTVLLLLVGGVALNLTPCVLPLIPINLAILGAGNKARTRGEGFLVGGLYGLAMALTYGALGLVVILTGSTFGALNASPWFNVSIAVIFVVLALGMFDVLGIDLSRFQGAGAGPASRGRFATAFVMGAIAALLAGACVAPVLISTLLLSSTLYQQGHALALLLPFVLGLGMGLPWPFAGAGLSFLPKPGKWMTTVKVVFGVLILGFAAYYGWLAYDGFRIQRAVANAAGGEGDPAVESSRRLEEALRESRATGKPVFIDFWATWCKNCHAMEATTFKNAEVAARLGEWIVVKYQAESPDDAPARDVLARFQAIGLPTYVVLRPKS